MSARRSTHSSNSTAALGFLVFFGGQVACGIVAWLLLAQLGW